MNGIERIADNNDLITFVLIIGFLLLFLMKVFNANLLKGYALAFFTKGFIEEITEQRPKLFNPFFILIRVFSVLTISLTIYLLTPQKYFNSSLTLFFGITILVFVYYLLKSSITKFIIEVFDVKQALIYFVFTKNGYLYNLCFFLYPTLILYQYCFNYKSFLLSTIASLLILRLFLVLFNNKSIVFRHLFYFILYFCTLEIAPLLLFYKTMELI